MKKINFIAFISVFLVWTSGGCASEKKPETKPALIIDARYGPISGSPSGSSVFLHYCLPDLEAVLSEGCRSKKAQKQKVQIGYHYYLGGEEPPRLEAAGYLSLPFSIDSDVRGKTPYYINYSSVDKRVVYKDDVDNVTEKFTGLSRYRIENQSAVLWIPTNYSADITRLGNPIIFYCSRTFCTLDLDLGNGWVATAKFDNSALSDWSGLYKKIYKSTDLVFGK
jgi:hypothetical protein